jgi:hypothetical protein
MEEARPDADATNRTLTGSPRRSAVLRGLSSWNAAYRSLSALELIEIASALDFEPASALRRVAKAGKR